MPYSPGVSQAPVLVACPGRCVIFFLPINSCRETEKLYKTILRVSFITTMEPPSKKMRTLLDDDSSDSGDDAGGVPVSKSPEAGFKINEDYAKRFEYNKKREEVAKRMFGLSN